MLNIHLISYLNFFKGFIVLDLNPFVSSIYCQYKPENVFYIFYRRLQHAFDLVIVIRSIMLILRQSTKAVIQTFAKKPVHT